MAAQRHRLLPNPARPARLQPPARYRPPAPHPAPRAGAASQPPPALVGGHQHPRQPYQPQHRHPPRPTALVHWPALQPAAQQHRRICRAPARHPHRPALAALTINLKKHSCNRFTGKRLKPFLSINFQILTALGSTLFASVGRANLLPLCNNRGLAVFCDCNHRAGSVIFSILCAQLLGKSPGGVFFY